MKSAIAGGYVSGANTLFDDSTNTDAVNSRELSQVLLAAGSDELNFIQAEYRTPGDGNSTFAASAHPSRGGGDINTRIIMDKGEYIKRVAVRVCTWQIGRTPEQYRRIGHFEITTTKGKHYGPYSSRLDPQVGSNTSNTCSGVQEFVAPTGSIINGFIGAEATYRPNIQGIGVYYCPEP